MHRIIVLTGLLLFTGCVNNCLQNISITTNRIDPVVTTSVESPRRFEISLSGNYSSKNSTHFMDSKRYDLKPDSKIVEEGCEENPLCSLQLTGDNVHLKFPQWSVNLQFSGVAFYKKSSKIEHLLRIHTDAQTAGYGGASYYTYKFGPVYSCIFRNLGIHPKILCGFSKINSFYDYTESEPGLISFGDTYITEKIGQDTSYKLLCLGGVTLECIASKKFSLFLDICCTNQWLFKYSDLQYVAMFYVEFTNGIRYSSGPLTYLAGMSIPYSDKFDFDYPGRAFFRVQADIGKRLE